MPKKKLFASAPTAFAVADEVRSAAARDRELRFLPINHQVISTPNGNALFLFVGRTDQALLPDDRDMEAVAALARKALKAKKDGELALAILPPVVRLHAHGQNVHLVVGDVERRIFPHAGDLRTYRELLVKCLAGHGRLRVDVSAECVVAHDRTPSTLRAWVR